MTVAQVSAPGKIILSGEYAVLRNAPAVVMAVDRRAVVSVTSHEHPWCTVQTPGYANGSWRCEVSSSAKITWLDELPTSGLQLVETVVAQSGQIAPAIISVDTSAFFDESSGIKFGLGSSAAATAALTAALGGSQAAIADTWTMARGAHAAMQGGSGADIAASCFGGLLNYRRDAAGLPAKLNWPDALEFRVFFSGVAASTRTAVENAADTGQSESAWNDLAAAAVETAAAWQDGGAENIIEYMRAYTNKLQEFDNKTEAGIFSAGHGELHRAGEAGGVVYKPCGAGGGDCGIAISTDISRLDEFSNLAVDQGFVPLDVQRDNRGL